MENILSGSISVQVLTDEEVEEGLEILMQDEQFEQDLINSFNDQMYVVKGNAPNPIWTLCSVSMRMIKVLPKSEIVPLDEWSFTYASDDHLIECLVGTSLIKLPKKYIQSGEWH